MPQTTRPHTPRRRDIVPAAYLRAIVESIVQRFSVVGGTVRRVGPNIVIDVTQARRPNQTPRLATITAIGFNTVSASIAGGDPLTVAKATKVMPALQPAIGGYTYDYTDTDEGQARTSDNGSDTEDQIVIPQYVIGDVIEIDAAPTNLGEYAPALAGALYQEVNSPRYWSKVQE